MKKITLLLMMFITSLSFSQVTIGTGNDGNAFNSPPISPYYGFSYSQSIYLASEIGVSGDITSIEFALNSGADISSADETVDVWIGHTTKSVFDSTTDWVDVSTLTQVLTSGTITASGDVLTITFNAAFTYNGTDNLVVAVDANESGYGSSSDFALSTNGPTAAMTIDQRSDTANSDPTSPETGTLRQNRGNITFNGITQACPAPTNVTATTSSTTAVDVTWTAGGSETNWSYEYGETGFTQGSGITGTTTAAALSLSSLTSGETYDIYIEANCGGANGDSTTTQVVSWTQPLPAPNCASTPTPADTATDVSFGNVTFTWVAPASGPTPTSYNLYAGETTSLEYGLIGNYTSESAALTLSAYDLTLYWQIVPLNGTSPATGCPIWSFTTESAPPAPANDLVAGAIALTLDEGEACGANTITGISNTSTTDSGVDAPACGSYGTPTTQGDLWYTFVAPTSGVLTLNTSNLAVMTSVAGAYYSGTAGSLTEEDCTEFGSGWPWTLSGLTAGDTYYLRVWDYGNDQIGTFDLCGYYSTCVEPLNTSVTNVTATSADISWDASGMTSWDIEWGEDGFTQGAGNMVSASSDNPYSLTGLTENTPYDVYVRTNCGGTTTDWVGPISLTTELSPVTPDAINNFDTFPGAGWSEANGAFMAPSGTSGSFAQDDFGNDTGHANGKSARINIYGTGTDEYLVTNKFDLSGGTYYLNFDLALTEYNNTDAATLGTDDYLAILVTQDNGANWAELGRWDSSNTLTPTGSAVSEITLTGYNNQTYFAFYAFSDTSNEDNDLFIDNFQITGTTLGVNRNSIENFNLYPTLVEENISFTSQEDIDNFSVYNLLGQKVFSKKVKAKTAEINLSTLKAGVYIVKVKSGDSIGSYKIVKE